MQISRDFPILPQPQLERIEEFSCPRMSLDQEECVGHSSAFSCHLYHFLCASVGTGSHLAAIVGVYFAEEAPGDKQRSLTKPAPQCHAFPPLPQPRTYLSRDPQIPHGTSSRQRELESS